MHGRRTDARGAAVRAGIYIHNKLDISYPRTQVLRPGLDLFALIIFLSSFLVGDARFGPLGQ